VLGYVACLGRGVPGHLRRHVVGYLALAVAMTGGAYAAITVPANSVGTAQLRDGSVTLPKIAKAARLSLLGPVGPAGPAGPRGPIGRPGRFTGHFASRNGLFKADVSEVEALLPEPHAQRDRHADRDRTAGHPQRTVPPCGTRGRYGDRGGRSWHDRHGIRDGPGVLSARA